MASLLFYIKTPSGDVYTLDATESFQLTESGTPTEYTIESGAKVSDHYVSESKELSLSGVITDMKTTSSTNSKNTGDFLGGLMKIKSIGDPLTLYWRGGATDLLDEFIENLVITRLEVSQDVVHGFALGRHSYKITIGFKQIIFAERATIRMEKVLAAKKSDTKDSNANTTQPATTTTTTTQPTTTATIKCTDGNRFACDKIAREGKGK